MINPFLNKIMPVRRRGQGIYIFRVGVWDRREKRKWKTNVHFFLRALGSVPVSCCLGAFVRVPGLVGRTKPMEMGV